MEIDVTMRDLVKGDVVNRKVFDHVTIIGDTAIAAFEDGSELVANPTTRLRVERAA